MRHNLYCRRYIFSYVQHFLSAVLVNVKVVSLCLCAAPADYNEILQVIPIGLESQNLSIPCVFIVDDLALENTEEFSVNITTTDDFVAIGQDTTQVFTLDTGQYNNVLLHMLAFLEKPVEFNECVD